MSLGRAAAIGIMTAGLVGRAAFALADDAAGLRRYEFTEVRMGTDFRIVLYAGDETAAKGAAAAAFSRVADLDKKLSDYDLESELSLLSATSGSSRAQHVSDDLWRVLVKSEKLAEASDGAFDVTVGPYTKMWRSARRTKTFPSKQRLDEARATVGHGFVELHPQTWTVRLIRPGMRLDLGGIAMGYAADEALAVVKKLGITSAMIDASGDIVCSAAPPDEPKGWKVGIAPLTESKGPPSRFVWLIDSALTTSGDAFQYVEIDGTRYSHIVDPNTGLGLTTRSSVTVTARDCTTADSLATAVSVLGPTRGLELIAKTPGTAALIVTATDDGVKVYESPGFPPDAR